MHILDFRLFQLEHALKTEKGGDAMYGSSAMLDDGKGALATNLDLRRKLEEEHSSYKRKLQAYQEGQQRQAQLVQKLQSKVLWPSAVWRLQNNTK